MAVGQGADTLAKQLQEHLTAAAANATGSASRVRRAVVLDALPSLDAGEITEKGSLNQRAMRSGRPALVEKLYAGGDGVFIA